jgi:hypothetical protein
MLVDLLVSPRAEGAYFESVVEVARAEVGLHLPDAAVEVVEHPMFLRLRLDVAETALPMLARLSFVQGLFAVETDGCLRVLDASPGFRLPSALVEGAKYRGKTHEVLTLLALNVAAATCSVPPEVPLKVLDPMAGRGTTLLWAARLGWSATGIERDPAAIADLQRHVKKQCKVHRIKHKETRGTVGRKGKSGPGTFVRYSFDDVSIRLLTGDARHTRPLLQGERFPLIVSDLPYGIQHKRDDGWRDPTSVLASCAPEWTERLLPGGSLVLAFNTYLPKRDVLAELFESAGLTVHPFTAPHRMSESIVRDLLVCSKPA